MKGCEYCTKRKIMAKENLWIWSSYFQSAELETFGVFIENGYLRFGDVEDTECMDNTENIKINFCPICGLEIK